MAERDRISDGAADTLKSRPPLPAETVVDRFDAGIVRLELQTPFTMGSTNCWLLIGDDDVLCVDPGWDASRAVSRIDEALGPYGRNVGDVDTILVTHTHADHCGAVAELAERADASVAVGAGEADRLAGRSDAPEVVAAAWRALGAPADEVRRAVDRKLPFPPVPVDRIRPLEDGSRLRAGGRTWEVHLVGGHSPAHVVLVGGGVMLAGDQLLANVLPAAHFGPRPSRRADNGHRAGHGLPWAPSVAEYLESMDRFDGERFDATTVLPGHGSAFRGTARPLERVRRYHRARCELVAAQLAKQGPTSVWDLTLAMYGGLTSPAGVDRRFGSAAAEVAGRLEALVQLGRATVAQHDGVVRFSPVTP